MNQISTNLDLQHPKNGRPKKITNTRGIIKTKPKTQLTLDNSISKLIEASHEGKWKGKSSFRAAH